MATSELPEGPTLPVLGRPRLPEWISIRPPHGERYGPLRDLLRDERLGTVCQEARCPNLPECWSAGAATIMLLGTECTRRCGFCAVTTRWPRGQIDPTEPERVASVVARAGLRYVVLTQVCRDDLPDGGAGAMAATLRAIRSRAPSVRVELLIGDLGGEPGPLTLLLGERPEVLAHNVETVERLSPMARDPRASWSRSLELLRRARNAPSPAPVVKSSLMVGLGETDEELRGAFRSLRAAGVEVLTLGQYLRPSPAHRPVERYLPPEEFARLAEQARAEGFAGVEAGPLVRSSYRAEALYDRAVARRV
ncbi:MAG: lipoyl synthase [Thermoplasmata archaeon]